MRALSDAGIAKMATPNPGRISRLISFMGKHPEPFGALGGAGLGAGTAALGGGDVDDVLLGTSIGAMAGGVGGVGLRSLRNSKAVQAIRDRLAGVELKADMNAAGIPEPTAAELLAEKMRLKAEM